MSLTFRPLTQHLGAEVLGVDLSREQSREVMAQIAEAWLKYGVLIFRDQHLSPDDQRRFTSYFGEFQSPRNGPRVGQDTMFIGNVPVDGIPSDIPNGEMQFHQDGCYTEKPTGRSYLYSIEIPAVGGNTLFSGTARAYASLPADLQKEILAYDIHFDFDYNVTVRTEGWKVGSEFIHPLVIAHPETNQPLLFCNKLMAKEIVGLSAEKSTAIIDRLVVELERPDGIYEHVWRLGDLVVWDNLATVHARTDFDPNARRLLRRTTTIGTKPRAYRDLVSAT
jgi:taurine dioxygenase